MADIHELDKVAAMRVLQHVALAVGLAVAYFALSKLGLALATVHPSSSPIWPPSGLAVAAVTLWRWPAVLAVIAGGYAANITTAGGIETSLAIGVGNSIEALVIATLIRHYLGGAVAFDYPGRTAKFVLLCFASGTLVSATIGVISLVLYGAADQAQFWQMWVTWWLGDSAGVLMVAPAILLWHADRRERSAEDRRRTALIYALAFAIGLIVFSPFIPADHPMWSAFGPKLARSPLAFLAIAPLMWAALGSSQRDTATVALLLSAFAVWGVVVRGGLFGSLARNESLLLLVTFTVAVSAPSLMLAADVARRRAAEERQSLLMGELDHRVRNILTTVRALVHLSVRGAASKDELAKALTGRIDSLARMNELMRTEGRDALPLRQVVQNELKPWMDGGTVTIEGPDVKIDARAASNLALALHELATNAAKYGALSVPSGQVKVSWRRADDAERTVALGWREENGPPVPEPTRGGFGTELLKRLYGDGEAAWRLAAAGVEWDIRLPCAGT